MKALINHLLDNNKEEILQKSIRNCHAIGVDSIMLLEAPGKTIRLYVCNPHHELWKDDAIAYHPHHCNLTLLCVHGSFINDVAQFQDHPNGGYRKYLYKSKIKDNESGFDFQGFATLEMCVSRRYQEDQFVEMHASEIHTVQVARDKSAAWLVFEGREDINYKPFCWSSGDPNTKLSLELYQPMTIREIRNALMIAKLL